MDPALLESMLLELWDGSDQSDRINAVQGLSRLGTEAALARVALAATDEDRHVRVAAVRALGQMGNGAVVEPLIDVLEDPEPGVARAAVLALAAINDARVEPYMRARLARSDWDTRRAAERWLRDYGGEAITRE